MTQKIDKFYGMKRGVSVEHEVLEAYFGAIDSPGTNAVSRNDVINKTPDALNYIKAHNNAKATDPRYVEPTVTYDKETGKHYIQKPHPEPIFRKFGIMVDIIINDLSK